MKKILTLIISIILSVTIVFAFSACSDSAVEEETTEGELDATQSEESTEESERITGLLYAVFEDADTATTEFSFNGGDFTPERIAAGFSGWTGLKFRISAETDTDNMTITIEWLDESSYVTGELSDANDSFTFEDVAVMRTFMTESLVKTIHENMGDYEVTFVN